MAKTEVSNWPNGVIVAIDGPGSSGKSSVGAAVADRLGLRFFDTGLLYRAVTWLARKRGLRPSDTARLVALAPQVFIDEDEAGRLSRVLVDGDDVSDQVRTSEVDGHVSAYAAVPELRAALLERQRAIASRGAIVMAGRDIGTVVLPEADVKIYLDASAEERARRRADERGLAKSDPERKKILAALKDRDRQDAGRAVAPLKPAAGGRVIRTDGNTLAQTVDAVVAAVDDAAGQAGRNARSERKGRRRARRPTEATPIAGHISPLIAIGTFIARLLARALTRVTVSGELDAFPATGPVILAANHASAADPVLVGAFLMPKIGRRMNWLGKRELFDVPILSWLARQGGVHGVDRGAADVEAFRIASRVLDAGHVLAIFPEGTRSPTGTLQRGLDGVGLLALRSGATIVPVGVGDSDRFWPKGRLLPRPGGRVTVRVGAPFLLSDVLGVERGAARRLAREVATTAIMARVAALLPERQRGAYAEAAKGLNTG
jgi:cytidylate kinase